MPKKNDLDSEQEYICCQCNRRFTTSTSFYKSYSGLYAGIGYLPACKACMNRILNLYSVRYASAKKGLQRLCMAFDLYYSDKIFDICFDGHDVSLGKYIRNLSLNQHQSKTFDTSIQEGFSFEDRSEILKDNANRAEHNNDLQNAAPIISPQDIEKWGDGFNPTDYEALNQHYKYLKNANPNCDSNQEIFINDLCYTQLLKMKALRDSRVDDHSKLTELYRKTFTQAGLKTVRDSSANEDFTIGVNAEAIEKYTPAEYYKNKELYRDFDDMGGYFERFILRPLRNLMHGTTDRDHEFYVKEEEDVDEFAED